MSGRWLRRGNTAGSLQQRLPFTNPEASDAEEVNSEMTGSIRGRPVPGARSQSTTGGYLSSSVGQRQPTRSFFHYASHGHTEPPQYASPGVREQTQELANWALDDSANPRALSTGFDDGWGTGSARRGRKRTGSFFSETDSAEARTSTESTRPGAIEEVSEPVSPEDHDDTTRTEETNNTSALSSLLRDGEARKRRYLSFGSGGRDQDNDGRSEVSIVVDDYETGEITETSALLPRERLPASKRVPLYRHTDPNFAEQQRTFPNKRWSWLKFTLREAWEKAAHPRSWNVRQASHMAVGAFAAVFLGLLLNILDALSYGMILFPLGEEIFAKTGPDGISMFYVSCIVSQLVYSLGGSRFQGGVGSEMIEVVPFFHKMAYMILAKVGDDKPDATMATVITSYALSSILTGFIFLLLGLLRLGDLVSFFPRSILLGCIGGVGVFLILTGVEVSAGLDSNMDWNLDVLQRLMVPSTLVLWILPLVLSILLMVIRHYLSHPTVMPAFFIIVVAIFYIVVAALPNVSLLDLQQHGWVFEAPEAGVPFYNFYTYYNFKLVDWEAIAATLPTMFALSFFGIIHVPINVPALGLAVQQDDVNINRELFGHGLSNALSGFVGSIQNYLVFANSRLFIQNGGNSRAAGVLLAFATFGVWVAGPAMIGYIPVLVVGTLIFMLGIEMVQEALWDTFGKLHRLEYLMVLAITLVMGFHDFVVGIVLGIVLACLIFVVQTSRVSAIRATYSGVIAESTVRRHPVQRRFLHAVGSQIKVTKLSGYLFFGTIVAVERSIKAMIDEEAFSKQPIRYLILDFAHVDGLDFSAAEAFVRMNRILRAKGVEMVLSGVSLAGETGESLAMVGLLEDNDEKRPPPRIFETLNQALEACENGLLVAFKKQSENMTQQKMKDITSISIPRTNSPGAGETMYGTPRKHHIEQAAATALQESGTMAVPKWQNFAQPLPLIMQTFKDLTEKDIDFWHRVSPYFVRREFPAGSILYSRGDEPDGFYVLEEGILRADYDLEQGRFYESIVAGTTCGELPFFAESERTGTVVAEKDCVAWLLTKQKWREIEEKLPDVANELLKIGLKLTNERMNTITSYVLVTAS
ncbi:uncharacterized protein PV09_02383 [Verruconis gallopava]|uniref:STAS domain-containing protein n=1 Tax=Verruconis gallopava TaxID=253628 RepID=A0A0D2AIG9_9PEZI|nr:uncharacterized protein PV09_02383 [Verruconis gallopava]KIW06678.1 hypothetical protein PV09_02383 [Verruconis gallopava]